jgi:glycosyltransferase involved in cell wall biosynthesis
MKVALVHDYLTQRGGAERVVLSLLRAFPDAPVYTSLYEPATTFDEFRDHDVRTLGLDRIPVLRRRHRLALPLLAPAFSRLHIDADVIVCSSSGWAHGARTNGSKVVYCHNPPRWLHQGTDYLGDRPPFAARTALRALRGPLVRWDRRAASTADTYVANSRVVRDRIAATYGIEAPVVPPPHTLSVDGPQSALTGVEPGFLLCVARLLPYKNVDAVLDAVTGGDERLVVVGTGPVESQLRATAPGNATFAGRVDDATLRWLYANCSAVVAASHEDFGLTPLEAAAFGRPAVVLRWGGFLDTVDETVNGVFFDEPSPDAIRAALDRARSRAWDEDAIRRHARAFGEDRFIERMRSIVAP